MHKSLNTVCDFVFNLQVSEVHIGPVRGDGLHPGLFPSRFTKQQQTVSEVASRGLRRV